MTYLLIHVLPEWFDGVPSNDKCCTYEVSEVKHVQGLAY